MRSSRVAAALALALPLAACASAPPALAPQPERHDADPYFLRPGFMGGPAKDIRYEDDRSPAT